MSAHLYWYAGPGQGVRDVDLGRPLADLVVTPVDRSTVTDTWGGARRIVRWTAWSQVRIVAELSFADSLVATGGLIQELEALIGHLQRGGTVALAEDDDCTYGGYLTAQPLDGSTSCRLERNQWRRWPGTPDLGAGDLVTLRGPSPESLEESLTVATRSALQLTFTSGMRHKYRGLPWVFARDSRFWPWLRLQASARSTQLLRPGRRILYTLDLPLEEHLGRFASPTIEYRGVEGGGDLPGYQDFKDPGAFEDYEPIVVRGRL